MRSITSQLLLKTPRKMRADIQTKCASTVIVRTPPIAVGEVAVAGDLSIQQPTGSARQNDL